MTDEASLTYGIDLAKQTIRDEVGVPLFITKCCEAIEKWAIHSQGIYGINGTVSKVAKLKGLLDRGGFKILCASSN